MEDTAKYKFEIMKLEMETVRSGIERYGQIQFIVKGWAITVFSGFVFFATKECKPVFLVLADFPILLFWILDSIFKGIQAIYSARALQIEKFLQNLEFEKDKDPFKNHCFPQIQSKLKDWSICHSIVDGFKKIQLSLLYLGMLVLLLVTFFLTKYG